MDTSTTTATAKPARTTNILDALRSQLRGALCYPGEPGYEEARTIWNAMIDKRPAAVIRAAGAADVMQAVNFAREHGLLLAVRGGGHNIAGNAVCDGGLMIDLSPMKSVRVDPASRTARVEPGATLAEFDREAQAFGLATPLGINSTTGRRRAHARRRVRLAEPQVRADRSTTCISADVVTADGELVHASAERERGPVLGDPRRRRQLRRRHLVRVPPAPGRPGGAGRPHRPPVLEARRGAAGLPRVRAERAG